MGAFQTFLLVYHSFENLIWDFDLQLFSHQLLMLIYSFSLFLSLTAPASVFTFVVYSEVNNDSDLGWFFFS